MPQVKDPMKATGPVMMRLLPAQQLQQQQQRRRWRQQKHLPLANEPRQQQHQATRTSEIEEAADEEATSAVAEGGLNRQLHGCICLG